MDTNINNINELIWNECALNEIRINDTVVRIFIDLYSNNQAVIICNDFIAIKYSGGWDEVMIASIRTTSDSDFIKESINDILKNNPCPTERPALGETKRIGDPWVQLNIKLSDGADINIVCQSIEYSTSK